MPALRELEAHFIRHEVQPAPPSHGKPLPNGTIRWGGFDTDVMVTVATLAEAQGLWYLCPLCFTKNGGPKGTHFVTTWFAGRGAPDRLGKNKAGKTVRWTLGAKSTGLDDLALTPSILLQGGCNWHGFIGSSGVPPGHAR